MAVFDLHLHTTFSDGDLSPERLIARAAAAGVSGVAVTDHNTTNSQVLAAAAANAHDLPCLDGIEISARSGTTDVHILGYSRAFAREVLTGGLAEMRRGYADRLRQAAQLCQAAGFERATAAAVAAVRAGETNPCHTLYDLNKVLQREHGVSADEAKRLTTPGGSCYVPYGDWIMPAAEAIDLIRRAGGVAVLAHPGIIATEYGPAVMRDTLAGLITQGVDGIEVEHPFHDVELRRSLRQLANNKRLLVTGGSDWHGPGRYADVALGKEGIPEDDWRRLLARLD